MLLEHLQNMLWASNLPPVMRMTFPDRSGMALRVLNCCEGIVVQVRDGETRMDQYQLD